MKRASSLLVKMCEFADEIKGKFAGMKKDQEWVVYPFKDINGEVIIQTTGRIAKVNMKTGKAMLSKSGQSTFVALSKIAGATEVEVPKEIIDQIKKLKPSSGGPVRIV